MRANPIIIQTISLILKTTPIKIPCAAGNPTLLKANANPPSRVPSCIGKKKIRFAKSDEPELTINDCANVISIPMAWAVK